MLHDFIYWMIFQHLSHELRLRQSDEILDEDVKALNDRLCSHNDVGVCVCLCVRY